MPSAVTVLEAVAAVLLGLGSVLVLLAVGAADAEPERTRRKRADLRLAKRSPARDERSGRRAA